jgi:outer membrane protein, multidrug efflux system
MRRVPFLSRLIIVLAALSTASVLAGGCMVGPDYVRPAVEQPAAFKSERPTANASPIAMEWWRLYSDPALDELIAGANSSNQNLRQAVARVDEARALARIAAGDLYPTLSVNPTFIRQRTSQNRPSVTTGERVGKGVTFSDWLVPFDLGYELDVWGAFADPWNPPTPSLPRAPMTWASSGSRCKRTWRRLTTLCARSMPSRRS